MTNRMRSPEDDMKDFYVMNPDDFNNLEIWTQVGLVILYNSQGEVLVLNNHGHYNLPGGKVKLNEGPFNAVIREAKEELGIDITVRKEYRVVRKEMHVKNKTHNYLIFIFVGDKIDPNQLILTPTGVTAIWIDKVKLQKERMLHAPTLKAIEELRES